MTYHKYSVSEDFSSDIILVDKMGILNDIYSITDITIFRWAFAKIGGHNPIEPIFENVIINGKIYLIKNHFFECIKTTI